MTVRTIPRGLAPVVQLLELEQPRVVTAADLTEFALEAGVEWPTSLIAQRLRQLGWLLPLATKGVWEFAPAARAGAFGSGDPLIELRAVLARDPKVRFAVAAESAAYLLGFASRRPEIECVGAPPGIRPPKSFCGYRIVRWAPSAAVMHREGLPVWSPATLLAFMATRPAGYHDWPNVGEWLPQAAQSTKANDLVDELADRPAAAWLRAAYLMERGGAADVASVIAESAPAGRGPYYLGDRHGRGRFHAAYDVIDSTGFEVGST
ncbi:MAG: type IV toxin-antitoxin system AbiEi family antitoxin [Actinobacteria bacterium]|nr:type IV toxin-antitoxin system AbiEi family antitoxin [Actinomycetota bacterium]MCL5886777.1 type IV toxin-antitoxin system AbiEi family antitoxin [Actinomycetota bacterium]